MLLKVPVSCEQGAIFVSVLTRYEEKRVQRLDQERGLEMEANVCDIFRGSMLLRYYGAASL